MLFNFPSGQLCRPAVLTLNLNLKFCPKQCRNDDRAIRLDSEEIILHPLAGQGLRHLDYCSWFWSNFKCDRTPAFRSTFDCKDQDTDYPRWIVESWERLLADHFRNIKDPESALVAQDLWFGNLPAVMRIRVTTPNVMKALRRRDPGAAKPYNFALSPILIQAAPDTTLVAPFSKHPEEWLTRDYTEIHSGDTVQLFGQYEGKKLLPQTLSGILQRHYLHPEDKSLAPDGKRCTAYTSGLLLRRPIQAMTPFNFIGKEVERRAQEGEDISVIENTGPIGYQAGQRAKTRAADAGLILRAKRFSLRRLMRESGVSQHAVERFLSGARLHPSTRARLAQAVEKAERGGRSALREVRARFHLKRYPGTCESKQSTSP